MDEVNYVGIPMQNVIQIEELFTIHYYELGKNFKYLGEVHNFWELLYVDKGCVEIFGGNKRYYLEQGEVIFHKPLEFHSVASSGKTAPNVAIISFSSNSSVMSEFDERIMKISSKGSELLSKIISLSGEILALDVHDINYTPIVFKKSTSPYSIQLLKIYIEHLLLYLIEIETKDSIKSRIVNSNYENFEKSIIKRINEILIDNIYGNITLETLSKLLNLSPSHICTIFKESTGESIICYFNKLKIQEAKRLMREESYNVTQISEVLGYNTIHYFSRIFKKLTNMSPTEYAKSLLVKS